MTRFSVDGFSREKQLVGKKYTKISVRNKTLKRQNQNLYRKSLRSFFFLTWKEKKKGYEVLKMYDFNKDEQEIKELGKPTSWLHIKLKLR